MSVTTLKCILEHVGSEFKHGADIHSSILNKAKAIFPVPNAPVIADPAALTAEEVVANMKFKGKVNA